MLLVPHVVGKHLMTKNEKVILAIIGATILTVFGIGATNAFAEEQIYYEPRFKFPIPSENNIERIIEKCGLEAINDIEMHIQCDFIIKFSEDGMSWWVELVEQIGLTSEDKQRKDLGLEDPILVKIPTRYDNDLIILDEKIAKEEHLSEAEEEYYALLTSLDQCQRGLDQARGIQETSSFTVGTITISDDPEWSPVNVERSGAHKDLAMALQECLAQRIHLLPMLGDYRAEGDVQSRQSWFGEIQKYHGDLADDIPEWSVDRMTQEANANFQQMTPHEILCESDKVSRNFKRDQGCTEAQVTPPCKTCNPTTLGIGEGKRIYPSDYVYQPNGDVSQYVYDNEPVVDYTAWQKYQNYVNNGDDQMRNDIAADIIADKQRQIREMKQTR